VKKLTQKEIDKLYNIEPYLSDPYFPKKIIGKHGEVLDFNLKVKGKSYLIKSSPKTGDTWWKI